MQRYDAVYFSPHLDDVVLSCPARLLEDRQAGRRVLVATLFTEADTDHQALYKLRRAEDQAALAHLGVEGVFLGLFDAPFRNPYYRSFRTIVLGEHPDDEGDLLAVVARMAELLARVRPRRCYFPLAVGSHIDHRLTFQAAARLPQDAETLFYEDRPYAFVRHAVRLRLRELGIELSSPQTPADLLPAPQDEVVEAYLGSFRETAYVRSYLPSGPDREWCVQELRQRWLSPGQTSPWVSTWEVTATGDEGRERIAGAVGAYQSQLGDLFEDLDRYHREVRAYARLLGADAAYAERCWRFSSAFPGP